MAGLVLVLNAGSSSLKFSVFRETSGGDVAVAINGQISGIGTEPTFEAKDTAKRLMAEKAWGAGEKSDRTALLGFLLDWIEEHLDGARLIAAGHRVVHGGAKYSHPVRLTPEVMAELQAAAERAAQGIRDPEAMRQACERMDRAREEMRRKCGERSMAVDLIREVRDEE